MGDVSVLTTRKLTYILMITLAMCSVSAEGATRRANTNQNRPAANTTQPQAGIGEDMSPEEEQELMEAAQAMRKSGMVQFNFKDMDLVRFMRFMSEVLQENIIVPPNINSKITIISPKPVTIRESREIMLSTLQMYNFSLQNMGSYSIVRQGGI